MELLSFFLFHLSYFCLFCLLVLPYYVVNKVEYIIELMSFENVFSKVLKSTRRVMDHQCILHTVYLLSDTTLMLK